MKYKNIDFKILHIYSGLVVCNSQTLKDLHQLCSLQKHSSKEIKVDYVWKKQSSFFFTSWVLLSVLKSRPRLYTKTVSSEWLCVGEQKLQNDDYKKQ